MSIGFNRTAAGKPAGCCLLALTAAMFLPAGPAFADDAPDAEPDRALNGQSAIALYNVNLESINSDGPGGEGGGPSSDPEPGQGDPSRESDIADDGLRDDGDDVMRVEWDVEKDPSPASSDAGDAPKTGDAVLTVIASSGAVAAAVALALGFLRRRNDARG